MRQRDLERLLEKVPSHPAPRADLEQVATPSVIAADVLYRAHALGDLAGKHVLDLGCGTGVLGLGAALLGAAEVRGVDVDPGAVAVASRAAAALGVADRVLFETGDVREFRAERRFDTAVQNPPFGAQARGADRPFLAAAFAHADVVTTFHLTETGEFVLAFAAARGARLTHAWDYDFPVKHQFVYQEKAVKRVPVTVFRFVTQEVESRDKRDV